ncbi:MAG: helix-turn-helix transcriptional regulator [Marmoricola sp.]
MAGAIVGRERELADVVEAIGANKRLVVVTGDAGVGKTTLVVAASARLDTTLLVGRCLPLSETLPLVPFADLLRAAAELVPDWVAAVREGCPAYVGSSLRYLVPDVFGSPESVIPDAWLRHQLFGAITQALEVLARDRDLTLLVEDLHWADRSTLDMLSVLAAGRFGWRTPILATFRTEDVTTPPSTSGWLNTARGVPGALVLDLDPLDREGTTELIAAVRGTWPSAEVAAAIFARSEGNPLFVEHLATTDSLPRSVVDGYAETLHNLTPRARALARVLAVAGKSVTQSDLAQLWPTPVADVDAAITELRSSRLLDGRAPRSRLRLRHALLADAVLDDVPHAERLALHAAAAAWLSGLEPRPYAEIAEHLRRSGDTTGEFAARVAAAGAARTLLAHAEEAEHRLRMLDLWQQVPAAEEISGGSWFDTVLAADWALFDSGRSDRDLELLERVLASHPHLSVKERATLKRRKARAQAWHDPVDAARTMEEAGDLFEQDPGGFDHVLMLADLTDLRRVNGRFDEALEFADRAVAACRAAPGTGLDRSVAARRALVLASMGQADEAVTSLAALADAEAGTLRERLVATGRQVEALQGLDRDREVAAAVAEVLAEAEEYGAYGSRLVAMVRALVATSYADLGRLDDLRDLVDISLRDTPPEDRHRFDVPLAALALADGRSEEAVERLRGAVHAVSSWPNEAAGFSVRLAEALIWDGRAVEAAEILDEVTAGAWPPQLGATAALLLARARADISEPRGRASRESTLDNPPSASQRLLVMRAAEDSRGTADVEVWERAASLCEEAERRYDAAYCRWRGAEAVLMSQPRSDATEALRLAYALADGHRPLTLAIERTAQAARIDLVPAELTTEQPEPPRPFGLTPREIDVLTQLTFGCTNPQIAVTLFMSPKTVSVHVSSIMRKLDAQSRTHAVAIAQRAGVVA